MPARLPILGSPPAPARLPEVAPGRPLADPFGRQITYLRISVTDRCNLRCLYCMPEEGLAWLPQESLLTFEEITRVVRVLAESGVTRVRLTGGEPTVRRDLVELVRQILAIPTIEDLALTTNGLALRTLARPLVEAGLTRFNVSLDTLDPERFARLTRGGEVARVLEGIETVLALGLASPLKLNAVVVGGINDSDAVALVRRYSGENVVIRFIEHMPFTREWESTYLPLSAVRDRLVQELRIERGATAAGSGPAEYWSVPGAKARVGFIHPVSEHFCEACNRIRLTATGEIRPCLGHLGATPLADVLRGGGTDQDLRARIASALASKPERHFFAEDPAEGKGIMTAIGG